MANASDTCLGFRISKIRYEDKENKHTWNPWVPKWAPLSAEPCCLRCWCSRAWRDQEIVEGRSGRG
eukprot:1354257-Amorphochlora_amoeboformis.AAC.1